MSLDFFDNNFVADNQDFGNGATDPIIDAALKQFQEVSQSLTEKSLTIVHDTTDKIENSSKTLESEIEKALAKNEAALAVKINRMLSSAAQIPSAQKTIQTLSSNLISANKDYELEVKGILETYGQKTKEDSEILSDEISSGGNEAIKLISDSCFGLKKDVKQSVATYLSRTFQDWINKISQPGPDDIIETVISGFGLGSGFVDFLHLQDMLNNWIDSKLDFKTGYQTNYIDTVMATIAGTVKNLVNTNSSKVQGFVADTKDETDYLKEALQAAGDKANSKSNEIQQEAVSEISEIKEEINEATELLQASADQLHGKYAKELEPTREYKYEGLPWNNQDYLTLGTAVFLAGIAAGILREVIPQIIESLQNITYEIRPEILDAVRGSSVLITTREGIQDIVRYAPIVVDAAYVTALTLTIETTLVGILATAMIIEGIELDIGSLAVEANQMNIDVKQETETHEENVANIIEDTEKDFGTTGAEAIQLITGAVFGLQKDLKQAIADFITSTIKTWKPGDFGKDTQEQPGPIQELTSSLFDLGSWF